MRIQSDFNHVVGATVLRANLSVSWYTDTDRQVISLLPKDTQQQVNSSNFARAWQELDDDK